MADLFTRLARRTLGLMPVVQPRIASRFAPEEAMANENTNIEIPSLFEGDGSLGPSQQTAAALSPSESGLREREEESITKTTLVEIERESPEKQELTPEGSSSSEERKETREEDKGKRETKAIEVASRKEKSLEVERVRELESPASNNREVKDLGRKEKSLEVERVRGLESPASNNRETKELGKKDHGDFPREEVLKSVIQTRAIEQKPGSAQRSSLGNESESRDSESYQKREGAKQIASPTESWRESYRYNSEERAMAPQEEATSAEVASRKEKSLEVQRVRELESPASNNREVKDLGRKEKSLEVQRVRGLESPASNDREIKDLGRKEQSLEVQRVRELESPASNDREVKDLGRKEKSLEVERVRELESPASNNRETKELGKKDHGDFPTEEVLKSVIQTRAIGQKPGSVQRSSLGNESESRDSESYQKREGAKQIASSTESWRKSSRYNSEERAIAPQEEATSAEVASRKEKFLEVERVRGLESPASNNRETKELGKKDHGDFPREEVLKSVIQTRAIGQKPGSVQRSSRGNESESRDSESYQKREGAKQIASSTESWRKSSRYNSEERAMAPQEEATSAEVASRKEKSLEVERVRGLESPASNNREVKELGKKDHGDFPREEVLKSVIQTRAIGQKPGSVQRSSLGNESESRDSESYQKREGAKQIASPTESWRESYRYNSEERAIAPQEEVTSAEVASRKEKSLEVERVRGLESPASNNREVKELGKKDHGDFPREEVLKSVIQTRAIGQKPGSVQRSSLGNESESRDSESYQKREGAKQIASPTESWRESYRYNSEERAIAPQEEVTSAEVASRKEKSLEVERVRGLESPASNNREVKELGKKDHGDFPREEVLKSVLQTRAIGQKPGSAQRSSRGNESESRDSESYQKREGAKQIASSTESWRKSSRYNSEERAIAPQEEATSAEVASRKEQSLEVERVRGLESPASNNREVKELGKKDHRDFPREEVLKSVLQTRAIGQKPGSAQRSSLGNESESRDSESYQKREGAKQIASPTESWRESSRYNSEERAIAPQEEVTSAEVASRKEKSLEVERVRGLESPASNNREVKELGRKEKSLEVERVRGLESPASNNREVKDLSSRREEKLSQFAPETVIELTEKEGETKKTETDRPVKLEDDKTGNNLLQLLESKLAEERKAPVAPTPTIQVTVGKIEVRGTKPAVKPVQQSRRKQSTVSSPKLSLDEYLKQRNGRKI